jgi:D-inositol-3-phosphate glycosyltransferase
MNKRIAIIGPAWPFRGGLANFNERLAKEWMARGNHVTIHTFTKQYPDFLFPGTSQFSDSEAPSDLSIERSIHAYNPLQWRFAAATIAARTYDLVLIRFWLPAMGPALGHVAASLVGNSGTRVVALIDNLYPHEPRPLDRWLTNKFIAHPHGFVTMSNMVASQLQQLVGGKPVCQAPHPMYDDYGAAIEQSQARIKLGIERDAPVLLFFGFIRKYKGLDLLMHALNDQRLRDVGLKVVIAGEWYEESSPYKSLAAELNLDDMLIWHDHFISESNIATYFSAADAVVQPYRNATQSGISALSFAYSKPLISTRVGGLAEVIEDGQTGFLCDPEPTSICDAIVRWIHTPDKDAMVNAIGQRRSQMTWERLINVIEACQ